MEWNGMECSSFLSLGTELAHQIFLALKTLLSDVTTFVTTLPAQGEHHAVLVQSNNKRIIQVEVDWGEEKKKTPQIFFHLNQMQQLAFNNCC